MVWVCSKCGHENEVGAPRCAQCGVLFRYDDPTPIYMDAADLQDAMKQTTDNLGRYGAPSIVFFHIEGEPALEVHLRKRTIVGRQGAPDETRPDIDLTAYQAIEKGVSRLHAVIEDQGNILTLADLDSTNGTFLNGKRLNPSKPRIIKSNDEIRLGGLKICVEFER